MTRLHPLHLIGALRRMLRNRWRAHYGGLDTIIVRLPSAFPPLPDYRSWWETRVFGPPPLSLWELGEMFDQIAADPRTRGVVLDIEMLELPLADLQTLRGMITRLRGKGRRVTVFASGFGTAEYYVASAADDVLMHPTGEFAVTGLSANTFFLKDALAMLGVELDVIAISPFKDGFDQFARSTLSPEAQAQMEWLLDSRFHQIVGGIAEGRGQSADSVRAMIDRAPMVDDEALASGWVDKLLTEDELPAYLGVDRLREWDDAQRRLFLPPPPRDAGKCVAVLRIEGVITGGESERTPGNLPLPFAVPLVAEPHAGSATLLDEARQILHDDGVGAVVLFIDSPGGSVVASEAIGAALERVAQTRPVIACMNATAASGGYWVALPATHIIAQPGTITGSIGVISAKPVAGGLQEVFHVHPVTLKRGVNADIYDVTVPFSEDQRARMHAGVEHAYRQFVRGVAKARRMDEAAVEAVAGGRVWTGEQALAHGLIDELGDFQAALAKARALAGLPDHAEAYFVEPDNHPLGPEVLDQANPAAALRRTWRTVQAVANGRAQAIMGMWVK